MLLSKAREIVQFNIKEGGKAMPPDVKEALIIHVEAVERIEYQRTMNPPVCQPPLKHETSE